MIALLLVACTSGFVVRDPQDPEPVPLDPAPKLVINEVQANNDSTVQSRVGEYADWVELYNAGPVAVELADVELIDGDAVWTGDDGALAPGDFAIVWADSTGIDGHAAFSLASEGERLELRVAGEPTDAVDYGELDGDASWARYPDGGEPAVTTRPTPGFSNGIAPDGTDPTDRVFQLDRVLDIELTIDDSGIASLWNDPYTPVPATFACDGAYFPRVSVHIKGVYGSLRNLDAKAAFKVDLNEYDDHRFRGLETLTLNNMVQDPSYVHEWMAYGTFRDAGVPAPRVGYTRVWLNGEFMGLYLNVETVDDTFLRRWWADGSGVLYEGAYGCDFDQDPSCFEYDEGPDPSDRSDIAAVTAILDLGASEANLATLETHVDMAQLRTVMAVESVMLHWDGYSTSNNYRIYHDPQTDKFQMIPWGTDQTFHDLWLGPYDGRGRLIRWCRNVPSCAAAYDDALIEAIDRFEGRDIWPEAQAIADWLDPEIVQDPRREFDMPGHRQWLSDTHAIVRDYPEQMRSVIP